MTCTPHHTTTRLAPTGAPAELGHPVRARHAEYVRHQAPEGPWTPPMAAPVKPPTARSTDPDTLTAASGSEQAPAPEAYVFDPSPEPTPPSLGPPPLVMCLVQGPISASGRPPRGARAAFLTTRYLASLVVPDGPPSGQEPKPPARHRLPGQALSPWIPWKHLDIFLDAQEFPGHRPPV